MCDLLCGVKYYARRAKMRYGSQNLTEVSAPFLHQFAVAGYEIHSYTIFSINLFYKFLRFPHFLFFGFSIKILSLFVRILHLC